MGLFNKISYSIFSDDEGNKHLIEEGTGRHVGTGTSRSALEQLAREDGKKQYPDADHSRAWFN